MYKVCGIVAAILMLAYAGNVAAWEVATAADAVQKVADKTSAKIDKAKLKNIESTEEYKAQLEDKIANLKAKIEKWQSSDELQNSETQEKIANARASIERLNAKIKALAE